MEDWIRYTADEGIEECGDTIDDGHDDCCNTVYNGMQNSSNSSEDLNHKS
jgi:hypothetical protein